MSFSNKNNNLLSDIEYLNKNENPEENLLSSLDNSFSLMISAENKFKYSFDYIDLQSLNLNKNNEIDKECSPAPAPLRTVQNDLYASNNMECAEVVNQNGNICLDKNEEINDMIKIFTEGKEAEEELIEKPYDQSRYFLNTQNLDSPNLINTDSNNNSDSGDKSAAANAKYMNSSLNKEQNLEVINSNDNSPINNLDDDSSYPKNNNAPTPLCSKNCKKGSILFFNTKKDKKSNKNKIYRKLKPDSLRKKIKARFHKKLRNIINLKLKNAGSKYYFDMLPQSFIANINIGFNRPLLNITMRDLFRRTFGFKANEREKIEYNIRILKYIEDNPDIRNNSQVSEFLESTYKEIILKYMKGNYLLEDIERLKLEGEKEDYINRYIFIAMHWIEFYEKGGL